MPFDAESARKAGYSDADIATYLAQQHNFDAAGAKKAGYSDADIVKQLSEGSFSTEGMPTAVEGRKPALRVPTSAMPERMPSQSDTEQWLGVANRALLPYAATSAAGAMVGGPAGAVLAPTALGLSDLGTSLYNVTTNSNVPTASESVRNLAAKYGIGREPTTPTQQVVSSALEAGAGALSQAGAANVLARTAKGPVASRVFNELAQQPGLQASTAAGAAALPTAAREYADVTDPYATAALTLGGGYLGAKGGAKVANTVGDLTSAAERAVQGTNISADALKTRAQESFKAADASGARYSPSAVKEFVDELKTDLRSKNYSPQGDNMGNINTIISRLEDATISPPTISELHGIRSDLSRIRGESMDKNTRRIAGVITDQLDNFITNPNNAAGATSVEAGLARAPAQPEPWAVPGKMPEIAPKPATTTPIGPEAEAAVEKGATALKAGISDYSKWAKSDVIEQMLNRAKINAESGNRDIADAIKTQFAALERNPNRMARFTEAEQQMIRDITRGESSGAVIKTLSKLAPSTSVAGLLKGALELGAGSLAAGPLAGMAVGGGLAATGLGANALRNMYAQNAVNNLSGAIRRGDARMPIRANPVNMMSPTWQNLLLQQNALAGQ